MPRTQRTRMAGAPSDAAPRPTRAPRAAPVRAALRLRWTAPLLLLGLGLARGAPADLSGGDADLPWEAGRRHALPQALPPHSHSHPHRARNLTAAGALTSSRDAWRGAPGVAFAVGAPARGVKVTSLAFRTGSAAPDARVQVYARAGRHAGKERSAGGWSLVHDARVDLRGAWRDTAVALRGDGGATTIEKGGVRSFFVWVPGQKVRYAMGNGVADGASVENDGTLRLYAGAGITKKFAGNDPAAVQSPRIFAGVVRYEVVASSTSSRKRDPLTSGNTRTSCRSNQRKVRLEIRTDGSGSDTSYVFRKKGSGQVAFQGPDPNARYRSSKLYQGTMCVDVGMYELQVKDRGGDGLGGRGYYKIEVQNQDGGWKAVRGAAFQHSTVHVLDVGQTESTMTDRDQAYLVAHNKRRKQWHARYKKAYVPLRWSKGLRDLSKAYARVLLDTCESGTPKHAKQNPYGENIARNKGTGGFAQLYSPDKIVNRFVEREEGLPWARNGHLTNALWRATKYVGCGEASKTYKVGGKEKTCRAQVCRYAKPGNCSMGRYKDENGIVDWETPMLMDDSPCKPTCPPEGCYDE